MLGLTSPLLSQVPGVSHRFFQRIGGTSPHPYNALNASHDVRDAPARVDENLARMRFQLGVPKDALFQCTQVHGKEVVVLAGDEEPEAIRARKADALATRAHGIAVGVRTADCAPVLLAVDDGSAVACAHAGWRGAVGGVLSEAVASLRAVSGASPERIVAAVGPTIGADAFVVGPEVIAEAERAISLEGLVKAGDGDRLHLDLQGLCVRLLERAGVTRVERVGGCTYADEAHYFSHRRDVTHRKQQETGRQLAAIARAEPPDVDDALFG